MLAHNQEINKRMYNLLHPRFYFFSSRLYVYICFRLIIINQIFIKHNDNENIKFIL